ncbi:MAG: thrombospondin type 3 repeat-containing protein [Deltaproteobacteria bacterium]|nr:thrombospondin type 3 repeat-containing protein [Deltaproteobacteria bacterium]
MRWITFSLALALTFVFSDRLFAQDQPSVPYEEFSTNRFVPANGPENYITVDGAYVAGRLAPRAAFMIDYAHRPFILYDAGCDDEDEGTDCFLGEPQKDLVGMQLGMNIMGSLTFIDRIQVGLLVPLAYIDGEGFYPEAADVEIRGGSAFALGDPRLSAKVGILGKENAGFFLAGALYMTAPMGHLTAENRFLGHDGFTGGLSAIAEYRHKLFRVAANLGGVYRPTRELLSTSLGSEMTWGIGGSVTATPLLSVLGELVGSTAFTAQLDENPMEVRLAGLLRQGDFLFNLGGGLGLVAGVGVPNFRVLAGVAWQPHGVDADGDGIRDDEDSCPAEAEDMDGYADDDGCPEEDNDGDGLPDSADKCPAEQEDMDKFEDEDGCPDPDNDKDGIPDGYDSCVNEPEDKDGDRDDDGCPDLDTDRDGIDDANDKCPKQAEDTDGLGDEDGCPEEDFDGDGIPDNGDECPEEPEDKDGFEDHDGCPEEGSGEPEPKPGRGRR